MAATGTSEGRGGTGGGAPRGSAEERILIVDDEEDIGRLVGFNLEQEGYAVTTVTNGTDGLAAAERLRPHAIVLDLMLPDIPGIEVCRRIRENAELADVAILMLTARGSDYDRVVGFEMGADDYVVKPFVVREVVLRVRALLRRSKERSAARETAAAVAADTGTRLRWQGLEVDAVRHRVFADGEELKLRPLEFKLIMQFLENPGRVFSRQQLLDDVWGISASLNTRTVDTHITRLRDRLGKYGEAVETVHGFGYRLREA